MSNIGPHANLFLSQDAELIAAVAERLAAAGVELVDLPTVDDLTPDSCPAAEAVLILDTRVLPAGQDIPALMDQVERHWGSRPTLICIAHSRELDLRLQALRAGAEGFYGEPLALDELAARLIELSGASDPYRILVVDDQPVAANFAVRVLERAGMQAHGIGDPRHVLETLEAFRPDLVLMDLHMPGVDGIELTALIREQEIREQDIRERETAYTIPIVFLSSELDTGKQMDTLRVGGNDFIAKPVRPEQLVATVRRNIRACRKRQRRQPPGPDTPLPPVPRSAQAPARTSGGDDTRTDRPPPAADSDSERTAQLAARIAAALGSAGLDLVYQPIVPLMGERSQGERSRGERNAGERNRLYEARPGLEMADGEYLPASDLFRAARHGGLLPAIDRQVLENALDRLRQEQATQPRLRFLLHHNPETLSAEDWLIWLRDQIAARDLIKTPPILQFQLAELSAQREIAAARFQELRRLGVETCLEIPTDDPRVADLVRDLGIDLIRLPLPTATSPDPARLTELTARIHGVGARIIVAHIRDPQTIVRIFGCDIDFIQGDFLQPPSTELGFDFDEAALL